MRTVRTAETDGDIDDTPAAVSSRIRPELPTGSEVGAELRAGAARVRHSQTGAARRAAWSAQIAFTSHLLS